MKLLITGDSHCAALAQGLAKEAAGTGPQDPAITVLPLGPGNMYFAPFYRLDGDHVTITRKWSQSFVATLPVSPKIATYDSYGFTGPFHLHPVAFDDYFRDQLPSAIATGPTSASRALVRRVILERKGHFLDLLVELKRLGLDIFVIETPLMFRHHPMVKVVPERTRRYLADLMRGLVAEQLAKHGIPLVELPPACHDDEHFMLDAYRNDDPLDQHHANAAWGALMIGETRRFCMNRLQAVAP